MTLMATWMIYNRTKALTLWVRLRPSCVYVRGSYIVTPDAILAASVPDPGAPDPAQTSMRGVVLELKRPALLSAEPPLRNIAQVQLQMHCCGVGRGVLAELDNAGQVRLTLVCPIPDEEWQKMMVVVDKFLELQRAFGDTLAATGKSIDELAGEMLPKSVTAWLVKCGGSVDKNRVKDLLNASIVMSERAVQTIALDGRNFADIPAKYLLWRATLGSKVAGDGADWARLSDEVLLLLPVLSDAVVDQFFVSPSVSLKANHRTSANRAIRGYKEGGSSLILKTLQYLFHERQGVLLLRGSVNPSQRHEAPHRQVLQFSGLTREVIEALQEGDEDLSVECTFDCYCTCAVGVDRCTHCLALVMHLQSKQGTRQIRPPHRSEHLAMDVIRP